MGASAKHHEPQQAEGIAQTLKTVRRGSSRVAANQRRRASDNRPAPIPRFGLRCVLAPVVRNGTKARSSRTRIG